MTDRELLELAAKAGGVDVKYAPGGNADGSNVLRIVYKRDGYHDWIGREWNPLTDDGDALRLAVKLDIDFYMGAGDGPEAWAGYYLPGRENKKHACQPAREDPFAATRRAIVRAAAEIGRAKP